MTDESRLKPETRARIEAGRYRFLLTPCSRSQDHNSCDHQGGTIPPRGPVTCVPIEDDWITLLKLASDYRFFAAHRTRERETYLRYAAEHEKRAQEAALELCADDDTPDLEYWRQRGDEDACKGVPELFRRDRYGRVHGIGADVPEDWSAQFEHVAGTAYLSGYALAEEA